MSTKIGNYSLSKDRSTVYFNDVIIFRSDIKRLSPDLYTEDGEVCFYDANTRSIYRAKENGAERVYCNVHFFTNFDIWSGRTKDGKTVFLKLMISLTSTGFSSAQKTIQVFILKIMGIIRVKMILK